MAKANWSGGATGALGGAASGAALGSVVPGIGTAIGAVGGGLIGGLSGLFGGGGGKSKFLSGSPETRENVSWLRPEQEGLYDQLQNSAMGRNAGGAFGTSADYYRDLLSDNSADYNAFAAPQLRQYNQDIVPGISEQFAGMGSGGLSSSGFRNAQIQGGVDLSERLGAIRANLRQAGAQGLQNIGQSGLGNFSNPMTTQPGSEGFLSSLAPGIGNAIGQVGGSWLSSKFGGGGGGGASPVGANTSPYGASTPKPAASPTLTQLPNFMGK